MEGPAESEKFVRWKSKKNSEENTTDQADRCGQATAKGQSIRSDALYPALSGEWEVPVTRNAKITPVNEGGGGRGASPPGSPLAGSPVTRNAEIDPPPRLR